MEKKVGTYKDGYMDCLNEVVKVLSNAEKDPKDITRLSMKVTTALMHMKEYNHGCN